MNEEKDEIMIEDEIISKKEHKLLDDYYASVGKQALAKMQRLINPYYVLSCFSFLPQQNS